MADGGILFCLLPLDAMFGARDEKLWRQNDLLKHHTLLSVISLPHELFSPAALKQVVGVVIKKGTPHPKKQPVFWGRVENDGLLVLKSKRLPGTEMRPPRSVPNDIPSILPALHNFILSPGSVSVNEPMLCKTSPIDFDDPLLELLPEAYIDSKPYTAKAVHHAMDDLAREMACYLIRHRKEHLVGLLDAHD
jgi:hypothetical protein